MNDGPDWVEQARRLVDGLGQTLGSALREGARDGEASGRHPADCRWCPVAPASMAQAWVMRGYAASVAPAAGHSPFDDLAELLAEGGYT
ncbi:hypothetical protein E4P41_19710, partial [Geodermatophilus sp. DF01-2]|uniref:hypothetical protein n=1 Tax=Geodermatophilus sp. DF01-2 TaxID=2559610 RepID=UPI001104064D